MKRSRALFKYCLRHCKRFEQQMRADALAKSLSVNNYREFWKGVKGHKKLKLPLLFV